ncbi:TPA_asm: site-specific DNA-methyltransferase [Listeria monocytogenes]|nr:site-specific DNA-methyltransferase [Listeria monocytogenes]HAC2977602.1 site-specific DNA-methyltransferase [Listeria monocytogenes]
MSDRPEKINLSDVHSRQVDTDLLNELRDLFVKAEEQKERYDFTWNGKAKAYFEAAAPTTKTLRAQPEESVNFEKSENLFITGDNLEALKLLQEAYLGKVDMIYIDPPYNTGKDFVYHDNFKKTQKENDLSEGSIDEDGDRLVKNEKSNGRYHSDWLTMMYPRLKLARNLLTEDGVMFVSIDDNEDANLKLVMDEIFGESNFVAQFIWNSSTGGGIRSKFVNISHQYVLAYVKNKAVSDTWYAPLSEEAVSAYKLSDDHGRYREKDFAFKNSSAGTNQKYGIEAPDGSVVYPKPGYMWRFIRGRFDEELGNDKVVFKSTSKGPTVLENGEQASWNIYIKKYLDNAEGAPISVMPRSLVGLNNEGTQEVQELFGGQRYFENPKTVRMLEYLFKIGAGSSDIIMDIFSGSGSTAQAVMDLNAQDGGNRKFILGTLEEVTPDNSEARRAGYTTIDQLSRERIRRAAEKIGDTSGFRALKVDSTGLKEDVFKTAGELGQVDLLQDIDNHSDNRSDYDLLYDVLVDGALEYNRPITIDTMNDEQIIKYDYLGELSGVVCYFGENLTDELTRQIATLKPLLAVFKESTFDKSAQKVNVMEQFRIISPDTKVKVI